MIKKYIKIFALIIKNISPAKILKNIFEYSLYFIFLNIVFSNIRYFSGYSVDQRYLISGIYLLIIFIFKFFYENAQIFSYLIVSDNLEWILLKPISPLFRILINKINISDLVVVTPIFFGVIYFSTLQRALLILSFLIVSFALFITILSLLLITSGKIAWEKALLVLFLIGFLEITNTVGVLSSILFAVLVLFLSFKFWDYALTDYTSASSQ